MKIKNKLIAGGLMSVVACALVGSITGTFAWYQYSMNSTISMRGVSVAKSNNLQLKVGTVDWTDANLTWANIKTALTSNSNNEFDTSDEGKIKLTAVSNGANEGNEKLNDTWYGNPDGSQTVMPETSKGWLQFSFYARIAKTVDGTNYTYPAGKLYVTDIAGIAPKVEAALRMHVRFGEDEETNPVCFLVNPTNSTNNQADLTLKATLTKETRYDWSTATDSTDSSIVYRLPTTATADANTGHLITMEHANVLATAGSDGLLSSDTAKVVADIPSNNGVGLKVTVTLWIEGFASIPTDATNDDEQWWSVASTIDDDIRAGFELTAVEVEQ